MRISVPVTTDFQAALSFSERLFSDTQSSDDVTIDFSDLKFVEPGSMLVLMSSIKSFSAAERANRNVFITGYEKTTGAHKYLRQVNFFFNLGIESEKSSAPDGGRESYIPINYINIEEFKAGIGDMHHGRFIDTRCGELAQLLIREEGQHKYLIQYSLREIIRNVIEHSLAEYFAFCGQYWPTKNKVEIAVIDSGHGILESLNYNPQAQCESDRDAVIMALLPGVSSKRYSGIAENDDEWQNSGYGLYMAHKLCGAGGSFALFSGNSGVQIESDEKSDISGLHRGTVVRMVINLEQLEDVEQAMARFVVQGELEATKYMTGAKIKPSKASKNLRMYAAKK